MTSPEPRPATQPGLEPPRRRFFQSWLVDATPLLSVVIVLRLALPSQLVIGPLGGVGAPATLVSLSLLVHWAWHRLHRTVSQPGAAVVAAGGLLVACMMLSYAKAASRPIAPDEFSLSMLSLLVLVGWVGVMLTAADGLSSIASVVRVFRRLVGMGALFAAFGLFQFVTGQGWTDRLHIPGLTPATPLYPLSTRAGFNRPMSTAIHPIEFGSILGMMLPLTIVHGLLASRSGTRQRLVAWLPAAACILASSVSSSRSTMIGVVVGVLALAPALNRAQRWVGLVVAMVVVCAVFVLVPGMVGSTAGLFGGASSDPSVLSRVQGYSVAEQYFSRSPLLGRGLGTFLPRYRIFDNQYLLLVVETGAVGVLSLAALIFTALGSAVVVMRRHPGPSTERLIAGGLFASCLSGAVGMAFFDGFGFPMTPAIWFLVMGLIGCVYRLTRTAS